MSIFSFMQDIIKKSNYKTEEELDKGKYYFNKGIQAAQYMNHNEAIEYFNKSIDYADYVSMVYLNRGAVLQFQERFLDARDDFIKAIEIETNNPTDFHSEVIEKTKQNMSALIRFCNFADKYGEVILGQIKDDGIDYAARRYGEVICDKMNNDNALISQFILEELEELDELGDDKLKFALQSGVSRYEYLGAVKSELHKPIHDEVSNLFKSILCCLSRNPKQMFEFRLLLINQIMEKYKIGNHQQ